MKKHFNFLFLLIFLSTFVYANDSMRVENSSRQISEEKMETFLKQRIEELSLSNNTIQKNAWPNQTYLPPLYLPHGRHNIIGISGLGDSVAIEDGSIWKIRSGYYEEALSWRDEDSIIIVPNKVWFSWFNSYNYKMINQNTNTFIEVKLHLGPLLDNPYTLQVISISKNEIILSDNTRWTVRYSDRDLLNDWLLEDGVIVGSDFTIKWFSSSLETILINVNMKGNPYIHATQVQ